MLAELVADVATTLTAAMGEQHDAVVNEALAQAGRFVGADRVYVFRFDWEHQCSSNTHEWCARDISPELPNLQQVPNAAVPWFLERLRSGLTEAIAIKDLPPEAAVERELLEAQSIQSILIIPIRGAAGMIGFMGFDAVRELRAWSSTDAQLLRVLATTLGGVFERHEAYESLRENRQAMHAVLAAIPDLVFSVSRDGRLRYSKPMPAGDLKVPQEEGQDRLLSEMLPPDVASELVAAVRTALDRGEVQTVRYPLEVPSGLQQFEARFARQDDTSAMVIVRNITEQVRTERVLEDQRERLQVLAARQSVEEELLRRHVASEVHDGIAQELAMARLLVTRALKEPANQVAALRMATEVLYGAVGHIDELIVEISPPALKELGLPAALREAGERLGSHYGVSFELVAHGLHGRLPASRESLLYWSTRELMINVVKHAEAQRMNVVLENVGEGVRITVQDDGKGIEPLGDGAVRGFGLFNTRERLRLAGGELSLKRLERGSRAVVQLPTEEASP